MAKLIRTEEFYKGKKKYFFECEKCGGEFWSWVLRKNIRPICGNCARERDKFKAKVSKLLKEKEIYKKGYEAGLYMAKGFEKGVEMINIKDNNDRFEQHQRILDKIHETYIQKNNAYGNSFDESCDDFGVTAAVVRLSDKFNRLKTLTKNPDIPTGDESVMDTLLDLSNYAILTYMWLENQNKEINLAPAKMILDNLPSLCKTCKWRDGKVCKSEKPCWNSDRLEMEDVLSYENVDNKHCKDCKYSNVAACDKPCLLCVNYENYEEKGEEKHNLISEEFVTLSDKTCKGCIYDGGTFCNKSAEDPCFDHDGYTPKEDK